MDCNNQALNNLNDFINNANQALTCDANCQKQKQTELLRQQYLAAEDNIQTGQAQLQNSLQSYLTFTLGEGAYQSNQRDALEKEAADIATQFQNTFNAELNNTQIILNSYEALLTNYNNVAELNYNYLTENVKLGNAIKITTADTLTNDRKTYYENQATDNLKKYNWAFTVIYNILLIGFLISIFIVNSQYSLRTKIIVFVLLLIYPYASVWLLQKMIDLYNFFVSLLPKNEYKDI